MWSDHPRCQKTESDDNILTSKPMPKFFDALPRENQLIFALKEIHQTGAPYLIRFEQNSIIFKIGKLNFKRLERYWQIDGLIPGFILDRITVEYGISDREIEEFLLTANNPNSLTDLEINSAPYYESCRIYSQNAFNAFTVIMAKEFGLVRLKKIGFWNRKLRHQTSTPVVTLNNTDYLVYCLKPADNLVFLTGKTISNDLIVTRELLTAGIEIDHTNVIPVFGMQSTIIGRLGKIQFLRDYDKYVMIGTVNWPVFMNLVNADSEDHVRVESSIVDIGKETVEGMWNIYTQFALNEIANIIKHYHLL